MGEEGGGRSCGTTRELQKLKQQAMEYYRENDVPRRLEELLNSTFYLQPADVYGHLSPPPKPETKKSHDGGKRGQQQFTGKMSHLGCLTINYDTIEQPLHLIQGICANLGLELGTNLHLAINCAAHELMDYDSEQWDSIYNALGSRCYIIAGAASKSISKLLEEGNISILKYSGLIIKHTNQTTMSDLVEITNLIDAKRLISVFGSTEGESSDDSLVDLAVGLGVRFIKLGGLSRGERVTKYNRLFTIEDELGQNGTRGFNEHTFFYWNEEAEKAGELPEVPEPIFPTEVAEELAKLASSHR
uniref:phosphopyruvate hydratase n=1 Tax=Moschus moschiferus TaxID=68415 RepID=A0A8C6E1V5_MOSMO